MTASASLMPPRAPGRLTGRKVLAILVAFFGTVATADTILLVSATRTWSGLEVASPYRAGQLYNAELARAREQDALGWHLDASAARNPAAVATVTVSLSDGAARPLRGKALQARLERPTDKRQDVAVDLVEVAAGTYTARAEPVARGQWDLVVEVAGADGVAFRRRHRIVLD
ncbi:MULTISPECIES: FixH family protein [unclassified Methylobacterium]|jgi:nitrogen fixation protein FixH|uniref:FixH family protein n=1 Tax=unclassified Methylobacterium TaxID=2615210 RepID=UPI00135608E8|nr:FixH family protein [Methylobacterium sp. 2A]MWV23232.1 FixH family protein [Methylobacterium sp. 2A]